MASEKKARNPFRCIAIALPVSLVLWAVAIYAAWKAWEVLT